MDSETRYCFFGRFIFSNSCLKFQLHGDIFSAFILLRSRLLQFVCGTLLAVSGNFLLRLLSLVGLIQSAALFQVAAVAICVRQVSCTYLRFRQTFCFACSHWLDIIGSIQSEALFQVTAVAICMRYVSRTCWRFRRADGLQWTAALLH
jgi:hypothetical protein